MILAFKALATCYFLMVVLGFMYIYLTVRAKYNRTVLKPGEVNLFNNLEQNKIVEQNITYKEGTVK